MTTNSYYMYTLCRQRLHETQPGTSAPTLLGIIQTIFNCLKLGIRNDCTYLYDLET